MNKLKYKVAKLLLKYGFLLLLITTAVLGYHFYILQKYKWDTDANCYSDNVMIEIIVGGLFTAIPLLSSLYINKILREIVFYEDIKRFIDVVKKNRTILGAKRTQELIIEFSNTVSDDIKRVSALHILNKQMRNQSDTEQAHCGVCGVTLLIDNKRCDKCKLNCRAWKDL